MEIDPEGLIERWVADLRSGKFAQGHGRLRRKSREECSHKYEHCCLGVLCETAGIDWKMKALTHGGCNHTVEESVYLPVILSSKLEVIDSIGALILDDDVGDWPISFGEREAPNDRSLSGLNDLGVSFSMIADLVEYRLLKNQTEPLLINVVENLSPEGMVPYITHEWSEDAERLLKEAGVGGRDEPL